MPRGRKPKSSRTKKVLGTARPCRAVAEHVSAGGIPAMPADLLPAQREVWESVAPLLAEMGVLEKVDGLALFILSRAAAEYLAECKKCKPGMSVRTRKKEEYWNLRQSAVAKAEKRLLNIMKDMGLMPSARKSLAVEPSGERKVDPMEELLT